MFQCQLYYQDDFTQYSYCCATLCKIFGIQTGNCIISMKLYLDEPPRGSVVCYSLYTECGAKENVKKL